MKYIIILCSLGTKWAEVKYPRDRIDAKGVKSILFNTGFGGKDAVQGDISFGEVARAGSGDVDRLCASSDTGAAARIMTAGIAKK